MAIYIMVKHSAAVSSPLHSVSSSSIFSITLGKTAAWHANTPSNIKSTVLEIERPGRASYRPMTDGTYFNNWSIPQIHWKAAFIL
jgi:hypothetical protein